MCFIIFFPFLIGSFEKNLTIDLIDCIQKRVVFCTWTGNNEMSYQRKKCLKKLKTLRGIKLVFLDKNDLEYISLIKRPFHPAYRYLSETQKNDYLKAYLMHFYGGGYTDIKMPTGGLKSWMNAFMDLEKHPECFINGYREFAPSTVAYPPNQYLYKILLGNGCYISRPKTELTTLWFELVENLLDENLEKLSLYPATFPQDCLEAGTLYPIGWNELNGRIFHKILPLFEKKILYTVPVPNCSNYR